MMVKTMLDELRDSLQKKCDRVYVAQLHKNSSFLDEDAERVAFLMEKQHLVPLEICENPIYIPSKGRAFVFYDSKIECRHWVHVPDEMFNGWCKQLDLCL